MTCCTAMPTAHPNVDGRVLDQDDPRAQELRQNSIQLETGCLQTDYCVPDMSCAGCINRIERELSSISGVNRVRANLSLKKVSIQWNPEKTGGLEFGAKLGELGYSFSLFDFGNDESENEARQARKLLTSLGIAGFAAANIMLLSVSIWSGADPQTTQLFHLISGLIAVPAVFFAGRPFFDSAFNALSARRLNMDVPISLAVLLALGMSIFESLTGGQEAYFDAAVTLLFFLLIGRYLDFAMREKARSAASQLAGIVAKGATVISEDSSEEYVPLGSICEGMRIRVRPGERFPVNCKIVAGTSKADRSLVTGESEPGNVGQGDQIEAGVLNISSTVEAIAISDANSSFLAEMHQMMEAAENGRGKYIRIADRMAQVYAPAVHLLAFVTFAFWMFHTGDLHQSLYVAISVLIITCPCALGLAVPVAHAIAAAKLLRHGILMRDGTAIERMAQIDLIAFDKTGTLTAGEVRLNAQLPSNGKERDILFSMAAHSVHPFSVAISRSADQYQTIEFTQISEVAGNGLEAIIDQRRYRLGRPSWVAEISKDHEEAGGLPATAFGVEGKSSILLTFVDPLRTDAEKVISGFHGEGFKTVVLSGDREAVVADVSDQVGIADYQFNLLPADKIEYLHNARANGHYVLMVGDGLNDAPALVAAHVSMAPSSACDAGRYASDFIFTRDSFQSVWTAWITARDAGTIVKQNFALAILYNCFAIPLAMAGLVTPLFAAIAMSASSIVVIANSLRLHEFGVIAFDQKNAGAFDASPANPGVHS